MERRKSKPKAAMRRLGSVKSKRKSSGLEVIELPIPSYDIEDALLSQIQVSDVLQNCVLGENPSSWSITDEFGNSSTLKRKQNTVYHRCYNDTTLTPLWQAFSALDSKSTGQVLLGRLMSLTSSLVTVLGEEHADTAVQKHFINLSQVPFSQYKRYVTDTTSKKKIDGQKLSALCWSSCKKRFLNNPVVDGLDSVVPTELCEAFYYLFCIFNKFTEPGTYPPSMDYEETELLLRKLFACLGIPWSSSYDETHINEEIEKEEDYESNTPLQITFYQLLSIIAETVGVELARSPVFYRAVQRLCLIEYMEVAKAGWLNMRKEGNENWKKRWAVLQKEKITFYDTVLCEIVKEELVLHTNMQVEALPGTSSHRFRFRVVEKEGFNIIRELEFSSSTSQCAHSWITLLNLSIKIHDAAMSAKIAEISERRLERYKRRVSMREVHKKKHDFNDTYRRLEEARKARNDMTDLLSKRSQLRKKQTENLEKITKIYERLEAIQFQKRLHYKEEREKRMMKLLTSYEESMKQGKARPLDDKFMKDEIDSSVLRELTMEKAQLESDLEDLQRTSVVLSSSVTSEMLPSLNNRSTSVGHTSYSSSENLSAVSGDGSHNANADVTI